MYYYKQATMKVNDKQYSYVRITSLIVVVILISTEILLLVYLLSSFNLLSSIFFLFVSILLFYIVCIVPVSLDLNRNSLIINNIIGKVRIEYKDIIEITSYHPDKTEFMIVGSGGLFGHIGLYYNRLLGKYKSYVDDYNQAFYIITDNKKYLLSCENRDIVIFTIKRYMNKI